MARRRVGRQFILDDVAATAWARSNAAGPLWRARTREAAFDLLSTGATEGLAGSQKSRLKAALRHMSVKEISHAAGSLGGGWGRYRATAAGGFIGPPTSSSRATSAS